MLISLTVWPVPSRCLWPRVGCTTRSSDLQVTDVQDFYSAGQAKGSDDPQILIMYSIQAGKIRLPIEGKRYTSSLEVAISPWLKSCWSGGVPIEMNGKRWKIDGSIQQCSFYVLMHFEDYSKSQKQFMHLLLQDGRSPLPQAQLTLGDLEQKNERGTLCCKSTRPLL